MRRRRGGADARARRAWPRISGAFIACSPGSDRPGVAVIRSVSQGGCGPAPGGCRGFRVLQPSAHRLRPGRRRPSPRPGRSASGNIAAASRKFSLCGPVMTARPSSAGSIRLCPPKPTQRVADEGEGGGAEEQAELAQRVGDIDLPDAAARPGAPGGVAPAPQFRPPRSGWRGAMTVIRPGKSVEQRAMARARSALLARDGCWRRARPGQGAAPGRR